MSNKDFEDKVLKALWKMDKNISELKTDVTSLKTDVSWLKTDVSSLKEDVTSLKEDIVRLDKKIDWVEYKLSEKIVWVEYRLSNKIDEQTGDLKQTMWLHANYLNQTFEHKSRMENEKYFEKKWYSFT